MLLFAVGSGNGQFIPPFGVAGDSRTDDVFGADTFNVGQLAARRNLYCINYPLIQGR